MSSSPFQHTPYGFNGIPEYCRTHVRAPSSVVTTDDSLGASWTTFSVPSLSASSSMGDMTCPKSCAPTTFTDPFTVHPQLYPQQGVFSCDYHHQPATQLLPTAPAHPPTATAWPQGLDSNQKAHATLETAGVPYLKAHFALEKVGVPYFQFPNGGMLPTPAHWPQHCTIDTNSSHPKTYRAFIGQVRFETTTEQIAWVLEQVTGVTAAFVAYHRNGCFVAHFLTEAECEIATSHHKKILFDLNGVWNLNDARPDQTQALGQVLRHKPNIHKHRLPRGCMVCEPFASTRNTGGIPTFPHHTHNQHQYPPVQHHHHQQQGQYPDNHAAIAPNVHSRDNSW